MSRVQLYVYDLSKGLAKSMSLMLTGKQIDGIWHTSVVVFGREIFFGQGIMEAKPGMTHHGPPMQVIECGTTEIDPDTFQEYLASLHELYTPSKYHLIDFNCNHFTADVVGFLTGNAIPTWISGLPAEFLSTPFGQAMRPQIDSMFRQTSTTEHPVAGPSGAPQAAAVPNGTLASSLLTSVATQATASSTSPATSSAPNAVASSSASTSPLLLITSSANFASLLSSTPALVVNFTNTAGCAPCRAIKPAYEALSSTHAGVYGPRGARFAEVELGVGDGQRIAAAHGVSATPTFIFYKRGVKVDEMKGADKRALEARTEAFLEDCFPRHPHRKVYLPTVERLSTEPIVVAAAPAYPALLGKLESFGADPSHVAVLRDSVVPVLQGATVSDAQVVGIVERWTASTAALLTALKPEQVFPLIDLWRIGLTLEKVVHALARVLSPSSTVPNPLGPIVALAAAQLRANGPATPKPLLLTSLRLLTNLLAPLPLANLVLAPPPTAGLGALQADAVHVLVDALLHADAAVRKAAGEVAVNVAAWRHRVGKGRAKGEGIEGEDEGQEAAEWEVEVLSAVLEGIAREEDEDVAHRLLVALALLVYLSPGYESALKPMLDVLSARETIVRKSRGWKRDVRKLADEVAAKLVVA
ncbi:hypothetical protein Q5752_006546 [Cryptotrichosporon argae]